MPDWTISGGNYAGGTLAAEGVSRVRFTKENGAADRLTFYHAGNCDGTPPVDAADALTLLYNSSVVFRGFVRACIPVATGGAEGWNVEVDGDAMKLARTPFWQRVAVTDTPATYGYTSRVTLGYDDSGTRLSLAEVIEDILDSRSAAHGLTSGSILSGITDDAPLMEMTDVTCLEAIQRALVWQPDAVLWFDHTANTINVTKVGSMTNVNIASATCRVQIDQRKPFPVAGVRILWETNNAVDGVEYSTITDDSSGTVTGMDVVSVTIPLRGSNVIIQEQECVVEEIPRDETDFTGADLKAWLGEKFPEELGTWAAGANTAALSLVSLEQTVDTGAKTGLGTIPNYGGGDAYPSELKAGAVPPWQSGISAAPVRIKIVLKMGDDYELESSLADFFPGEVKLRELYYNCTGTDAASITYTKATDTGDNESPVTGLAAAWRTALNANAPACTVEIPGTEPDLTLYPGKKMTLTGTFALGPAVIQAVTVDVDAGITTVTCGPVSRLTPTDLVERMRAGGRRSPVVNGSGTQRTDSELTGRSVATVAAAGNAHTQTPMRKTSRGYFEPILVEVGKVKIAAGAVVWNQIEDWEGCGTMTFKGRLTTTAASSNITVASGDYVWAEVTRTSTFEDLPVTMADADTFQNERIYSEYSSISFNSGATLPTNETDKEIWPLAYYSVSGDAISLQNLHSGAAIYCPAIFASYIVKECD